MAYVLVNGEVYDLIGRTSDKGIAVVKVPGAEVIDVRKAKVLSIEEPERGRGYDPVDALRRLADYLGSEEGRQHLVTMQEAILGVVTESMGAMGLDPAGLGRPPVQDAVAWTGAAEIERLQAEARDLRAQLRHANAYITRRDATIDLDHLHADVMDAALSRVQATFRSSYSWINDDGVEVVWETMIDGGMRWTYVLPGGSQGWAPTEVEALQAWLAAWTPTPAPEAPVTGATSDQVTAWVKAGILPRSRGVTPGDPIDSL